MEKLYRVTETQQIDLDEKLEYQYNERTNQGKRVVADLEKILKLRKGLKKGQVRERRFN